MPWLDHGIHSVTPKGYRERHGMDCRVKPGNDDSLEAEPIELACPFPWEGALNDYASTFMSNFCASTGLTVLSSA